MGSIILTMTGSATAQWVQAPQGNGQTLVDTFNNSQSASADVGTTTFQLTYTDRNSQVQVRSVAWVASESMYFDNTIPANAMKRLYCWNSGGKTYYDYSEKNDTGQWVTQSNGYFK